MRKVNRSGYTVPELLMVLAIVGIMFSILAPVYVSACECRNSKNQMARTRQITEAFKMYAYDWDETLRPVMPHHPSVAKILTTQPDRHVCGRVNTTNQGVSSSTGENAVIFKSRKEREITALAFNASGNYFHIIPLVGSRYVAPSLVDDPPFDYEDNTTDYSETALAGAAKVTCELTGEWPVPCKPAYSNCAYVCDDGKTIIKQVKRHPTYGCPDFAYPKIMAVDTPTEETPTHEPEAP